MKNKLNIPIILGASRPQRRSEKVATFIHTLLKDNQDVETSLVDVRDYQIEYDDDKSIPEFHQIVTQADAFVLVFPEYNHGFPGKLKSLLDTEFEAYKHKPALLAGVSSGDFGGARAIELIMPVLQRLGFILSDITLYFPNIKETFDESNNPKDEKVSRRTGAALEELIYITRVIKEGKKVLDK
jgi:NAD(P)H-dependent FMN reductase